MKNDVTFSYIVYNLPPFYIGMRSKILSKIGNGKDKGTEEYGLEEEYGLWIEVRGGKDYLSNSLVKFLTEGLVSR